METRDELTARERQIARRARDGLRQLPSRRRASPRRAYGRVAPDTDEFGPDGQLHGCPATAAGHAPSAQCPRVPDDRGGDLAGSGGAADAAGQQNLGGLSSVDLFDDQAIPQGGWVMADVAGRAVSDQALRGPPGWVLAG